MNPLQKSLGLGAVLLLSSCSQNASTPSATVFHNAQIITMDGAYEASAAPEAFRVEDGRITALGALSDISHNAKRVDLNGAAVIPGVVDSHVHVRELGMDAIKVDLVGAQTMEEIVARIRDQRPNIAPGDWIIGQGWDEGRFADYNDTGTYPDAGLLTEAFPDNPVGLESLHGFGGMANQAALDIAGIDADTPDPQGGTILRREDGSPTGVLLMLAQRLVFDQKPEPSQADLERAIVAGLSQLAAKGVTSVHEAGMEAEDVAAFKALAERGELPIRVFGLLNGNDKDLMADWFATGPLNDPTDMLDIGGIKVFFDGSLGSRTAMMYEPYSDQPEARLARARITLDDIDKLAIQARDRGFQMAVHAIGDEANDCIVASYELRLAAQPYDHRWRIEHAQVVGGTFARRAADLGIIASMQPSHAMGDSPWAEARVGPERIRFAYAWRSFLRAGVPLIFNSDLPGEPWAPMETLHFATTRTTLDGAPAGGWYANEALGREASLRAMTLDGAHAAFQDDTLGSLALDKWADFVVLSDNPMTASDVRDIEVKATYVAGEQVGG
jgi:predicted amidohydrolase YtcJ